MHGRSEHNKNTITMHTSSIQIWCSSITRQTVNNIEVIFVTLECKLMIECYHKLLISRQRTIAMENLPSVGMYRVEFRVKFQSLTPSIRIDTKLQTNNLSIHIVSYLKSYAAFIEQPFKIRKRDMLRTILFFQNCY